MTQFAIGLIELVFGVAMMGIGVAGLITLFASGFIVGICR